MARQAKASSGPAGFVEQMETSEGRSLTRAEAINRFLMQVEAGQIDPSKSPDIVKDIARRFKAGTESVQEEVEAQAEKRANSVLARVKRVQSVVQQ